MTTKRNIALDGPQNGLYIDGEQALADGYEHVDWYEGENAWMHTNTALDSLTEDGVPVELEEDYPR